jgi:hypothetical protein
MKSAQNDSTRPTAGHFYTPGVLATLEETAAALQVDSLDLRSHCDRYAQGCGTIAAVRLPGGVMGFRVHETWRFRFPIAGSGPEPNGSHEPPTGEDR